MKKHLLLLPVLGIIVLSGCSLTDTNPSENLELTTLTNQIALMQEQVSWMEDQISQFKEENIMLKEERDNLKEENKNFQETIASSNSWSDALLIKIESLEKNVDKYRQALLQEKIKNSTSQNNSTEIKPSIETLINSEINNATEKSHWYVTQVYTNEWKQYLKIDFVNFWEMWPGGASEIINNNPLIRTFEIDTNSTFTVLKYNSEWGPEPKNVWRNEFGIWWNWDFASINSDVYNPIYYWAGETSIVEIDYKDKVIYKISEIYRP